MNKQTKYDAAIRDLMHHDSNASWNEILSECNGNYTDACHKLVLCLGQAIEDNEEARPFYKSILESLIIQ